ncbi:hypothetical protein C8R44DRAFT_751011 [Mycena epipterygia]|nr:hypothetical protein C8R44DRAFT_751011 [Mycena epipterygia]
MPDNRSSFVVTATPDARFVALPVSLSSRRRHAKCRPMVETLHVDGKANPYLHDFDVKLAHGEKTSYFRIFLKRGKRVGFNQHAVAHGLVGEIAIMRLSASHGTTLINSRTTDGPIMDFVLAKARARIRGFQEPKRNKLPVILKMRRATAFPGPA